MIVLLSIGIYLMVPFFKGDDKRPPLWRDKSHHTSSIVIPSTISSRKASISTSLLTMVCGSDIVLPHQAMWSQQLINWKNKNVTHLTNTTSLLGLDLTWTHMNRIIAIVLALCIVPFVEAFKETRFLRGRRLTDSDCVNACYNDGQMGWNSCIKLCDVR